MVNMSYHNTGAMGQELFQKIIGLHSLMIGEKDKKIYRGLAIIKNLPNLVLMEMLNTIKH